MSAEFRFRKDDHTYWLGDRRLIGVSEAMEAAGLVDYSMIDPDVLKHAMERGTAVHKACHYFDDGDLDWSTVSPEIEPYVRAWERFKSDTCVKLHEVEEPCYNEAFGFAGTPDRSVSLGIYDGIIDLKTYKPSEVTGIQLAAYARLVYGPQFGICIPKRWGLWLKEDGKYSLTEYTDRGDEAVFMSCLVIAKFKGRLK